MGETLALAFEKRALSPQATLSSALIGKLDPAVSHSVQITATDAFGQPATMSIPFKVDLTEPPIG